MVRPEADPADDIADEIVELHREAQRRLEPLNEDIKALIARQGDRKPEDLVPAVEVIMRRHGMTEPSRDGIVQWIDQAMAESRAGAASPAGDPPDVPGR
jgi:hypothetical protein